MCDAVQLTAVVPRLSGRSGRVTREAEGEKKENAREIGNKETQNREKGKRQSIRRNKMTII